MKQRKRKRPPEECPHCGAQFRAGRLACPECGSDAKTGWRDAEDIEYQSVEIPDTYDELVGASQTARPGWITITIIVCLASVAAVVLTQLVAML